MNGRTPLAIMFVILAQMWAGASFAASVSTRAQVVGTDDCDFLEWGK